MNEVKLTIALSGLNNVDSPGPGIPVIRGIRESKDLRPRIIGLAYDNLEPGSYMHDLVDRAYKVPYPSEGVDSLMERISYIHKREKIDVLIPNFDSEIFIFIKLAEKLKLLGIDTFLPALSQFEERNKDNLSRFGEKYKILVPKSFSVASHGDIQELLDNSEIRYPFFVKGKFYDANIAYNAEQAKLYFMALSAKWGLPVIIQEFVKGTEVNVVALGDGRGNTIGAVPMRKQYITDKGKAWGGITLDDPELLQITGHIISSTKWRGGMELELIRTSKNEYYLIEINPRLPAWVYLAVAAGQNLPEALVKMAIGQDVPAYTKFDIGKIFIRYSYDMICDFQEFQKFSTTGEL